ncbi:MAG: hypothetical protein U0326_41045 [Polyangiales bacterium]
MRRVDLLATLSAAALSVSCGGDLDPAWKIKTFRVLGARIENVTRAASDPRAAEGAPGETVRLTISTADPAATQRDVQVVWVICAQTARTGNTFGCAPEGASILRGGLDQSYTIPNLRYGTDPFGRARVQGLALVCAGGTVGFDATTRQPTCTGDNAESTLMTRSILVRTTEADAINHNPALTEAVLYLNGNTQMPVTLGADMPARVPRCTTDPCTDHVIELRVGNGSRETYRTLDTQGASVSRAERLQFGYFTTGGEMDLTFYVDTAERPEGPVRNKWKAPRTAGNVTFVFSAQDTRGGFEWITRTVTVE